jgi:hypothetical protein
VYNKSSKKLDASSLLKCRASQAVLNKNGAAVGAGSIH